MHGWCTAGDDGDVPKALQAYVEGTAQLPVPAYFVGGYGERVRCVELWQQWRGDDRRADRHCTHPHCGCSGSCTRVLAAAP